MSIFSDKISILFFILLLHDKEVYEIVQSLLCICVCMCTCVHVYMHVCRKMSGRIYTAMENNHFVSFISSFFLKFNKLFKAAEQ